MTPEIMEAEAVQWIVIPVRELCTLDLDDSFYAMFHLMEAVKEVVFRTFFPMMSSLSQAATHPKSIWSGLDVNPDHRSHEKKDCGSPIPMELLDEAFGFA
jgi:hypothetical protein